MGPGAIGAKWRNQRALRLPVGIRADFPGRFGTSFLSSQADLRAENGGIFRVAAAGGDGGER